MAHPESNHPLHLVIDAGNSQISIGVFGARAPKTPQARLRLPTHPIGTPDEILQRLGTGLAAQGFTWSDFEKITLASVVPEWTTRARDALPSIRVLDSECAFSFQVSTTEPSRTGIDRLVNAEAAFQSDPKSSFILIDAGTATTVDALSAKGVFLGGAIAPGLNMLRDCLAEKTAQLPKIPIEAPLAAIGRNTQSALQSGIVLGHAAMIDGLVARMRIELQAHTPSRPIRVVATGGWSPLLSTLCQSFDSIDPDLTLQGIRILGETP